MKKIFTEIVDIFFYANWEYNLVLINILAIIWKKDKGRRVIMMVKTKNIVKTLGIISGILFLDGIYLNTVNKSQINLDNCKKTFENLVCINKGGQVVYQIEEQTKVDKTIKERVNEIAVATDKCSGESRILALTKNGNIYYSGEIETYPEEITFTKIERKEKIKNIMAYDSPVETICEREELYVETSNKEIKLLQSNIDKEATQKVSIDKTVEDIYPFKKSIPSILGEDFRYYLHGEKKLALGDENKFLTFHNQIIQGDHLIMRKYKPYSSIQSFLKEDYLLGIDGYLYVISFSKEMGTNYNVQLYSTAKIKEHSSLGGFTNITLEDGTVLSFGEEDYRIENLTFPFLMSIRKD